MAPNLSSARRAARADQENEVVNAPMHRLADCLMFGSAMEGFRCFS